MQQKLCLWLCVAVLVGALSTGNPFLPATPAATTGVAAPAVALAVDPPAAIEVAPAPGPVVLALNARPAGEPRSARKGLLQGTAAPAVVPAALRAPVATDASGTLCPDVSLRELVTATDRTADGSTIWVLRDGRRLVRNPDPAGRPLLVPVADSMK